MTTAARASVRPQQTQLAPHAAAEQRWKRTARTLTEKGSRDPTAGAVGGEGHFQSPARESRVQPLARTAASAERLGGGASTLPGPERRTAVTLNEGLPCHESTTLQNVTDQGNEEERPAFGNRMREQSRRWADMQRFRHWVIFVSNACESRRLTRPPEAAEAAFLVRTTRTCRPR